MPHFILENLKLAFAIVAVVAMFGYFMTISSVLTRLDLYHHEVWVRLGSARVMPASFAKQFLLNRFVVLGEYRALDDKVLNKRGLFARCALFAVILCIALAPVIAPDR
jgi:hypothetical protein